MFENLNNDLRSMADGYPDAIDCSKTQNGMDRSIFYAGFLPTSSGDTYEYYQVAGNKSLMMEFYKNDFKNSDCNEENCKGCLNKSLAELVREGRTFKFNPTKKKVR